MLGITIYTTMKLSLFLCALLVSAPTHAYINNSWASCSGLLEYIDQLLRHEPAHPNHERSRQLITQYQQAAKDYQQQHLYAGELSYAEVFSLGKLQARSFDRFHQVDGFGNRIKASPKFIQFAQDSAGLYCQQWSQANSENQ